MVKNTIGGKKGKMLSNKRSGNGGEKKIRLSLNENEIYVCVTKVFGGGLFEVVDNNNEKYTAHLRGKMKGTNKRHNFVSLFSMLLVGLRSDLSDSSICDILFVYDDNDVHYLSLLSSLSISNIIYFHQNHDFSNKHNHSDLFSNNISDIAVLDSNIDQNISDLDISIDFNDI
jgi:hypothetical protein